MPRLKYKNAFGSQVDGSSLDLQRADLFKVTLELPTVLGLPWDEHVEFAVEKFVFPTRAKEAIAVKYMQQTNFLIGGDSPSDAAEIPVRYAFAQRTVEALEKWSWLIANPLTGGVGLTSQVKCKGYVRWLVPNWNKQVADIRNEPRPGEDTMMDGAIYTLEGCWPRNLKFSDGDVTSANGYVTMTLSLMMDRWYPMNIDRLQVQL